MRIGIITDIHYEVEWDATAPLQFSPERRYLIVVGPLVSGHFGVYDTNKCILTPFHC